MMPDNEPRRRAIVSLIIPDDTDITHDEKQIQKKRHLSAGSYRSWRRKKKDVITMAIRLLSTIYAILLVLYGIIFPASEALHNTWLNSYYNGIFMTYIYVVGIVFLIYLQVYIIPVSHRKKKEAIEIAGKAKNTKIAMQPQGDQNKSYSQLNGWMVQDDLNDISKANKPLGNLRTSSVSSMSSVALVNEEAEGQTWSWISLEGLKELFAYEGSSFYLRLGALVFGIGNMIYIGLEIDYFMISVPDGCEPGTFGWTFTLRLIFTLLQTFFLFKHSKVEIVIQQNVARCGFMHIIATNLCVWISTLISEIIHVFHESHDEHTTEMPVISTAIYPKLKASGDDNCTAERELLSQASPYLFPFVLEYSLIATGVFAIMSSEVVQKDHNIDIMNKVQNMMKAKKQSSKRKRNMSGNSDSDFNESVNYVGPLHTHSGAISLESSHRGMFIGIILLTGVIVSMVLFMYDQDHGEFYKAQLNYLIADLVLHSLILIANLMAMFSLAKLPIALTLLSVDDILLLVSMSGSFMFEISILVSTAVFLKEEQGISDNDKTTTQLALCCSVVAACQTVVQAILVISGLRRYSRSKDEKPGREAITFLIVANVTAWIFRTVQVKELELGIQEEFYGTLAWLFILNLNLPLLLFFRFHSSVCFADIWFEAYKPVDHDSLISQQPPEGLHSSPSSPTLNGSIMKTDFYIDTSDSIKEEPEHSVHL